MPSAKESLFDLVTRCCRGSLTLLLDYDGTLVAIAPEPELAPPDDDLIALLQALATRDQTTVHIVSGRPRESLQGWLGAVPVHLWAEHGLWHRPMREVEWRQTVAVPDHIIDRVLPLLRRFTRETPGAILEVKSASTAWHYRQVDARLAGERVAELQQQLLPVIGDAPLEILQGKRLLEVRVRGVNKSIVCRRVLADAGKDETIFALGDDQTDEDMFAALPSTSVTVAVGGGPSRANYTIDDPDDARALLQRLVR